MSCKTWRDTVGIKNVKGKKVKEESVKRVLLKYNLNIKDDEADAINLCDAYCIKHNYA